MAFKLEPLPYPRDALAPHLSTESLALHHGKHHAGYVKRLNRLVAGTPLVSASLESLIRRADGPVFENAAQIWNHDFFWRSMKPGGGGRPNDPLRGRICSAFGSLGSFRDAFVAEGESHFGSGWLWLVAAGDELRVTSTHDADCPLRHGQSALLCVDLWEHSYYLDYRNERAKYLRVFLGALVDWDFVARNAAAVSPV